MWRQIEDHCGPFDKLRTGIEEPAVIERILMHLGLCAQPPPRAPARRVDLFQAARVVNSDWFFARASGWAQLAHMKACRLDENQMPQNASWAKGFRKTAGRGENSYG